MNVFYSFFYSRALRLYLIIVRTLVVVGANLFVARLDTNIVIKTALFIVLATLVFDVVLLLSTLVVTGRMIDKLITALLHTTGKRTVKPFIYVITALASSFAILFVVSWGSILLDSVVIISVAALLVDGAYSLYMSYVIATMPDDDDDE